MPFYVPGTVPAGERTKFTRARLLAASPAGEVGTFASCRPARRGGRWRCSAPVRKALAGSQGRAAQTVYGGHDHALRQTVIALSAGSSLSEHENPGEATVHVLTGRVRLDGIRTSWEGRAGDLLVVPQERHSLAALEDSAFLLTVVKHP